MEALSYQCLVELLDNAKKTQSKSFFDTVERVKANQEDPGIKELKQFLSQEGVKYTTFSHV